MTVHFTPVAPIFLPFQNNVIVKHYQCGVLSSMHSQFLIHSQLSTEYNNRTTIKSQGYLLLGLTRVLASDSNSPHDPVYIVVDLSKMELFG